MDISLDTALKLKNACHLMMNCMREGDTKSHFAEFAYGKAKEAVDLAKKELKGEE